jgi:hypothetical protein
MSKFTLLMWLLIQLIAYRDQQRAEYYGEFPGATVSGSGAAKREQERLRRLSDMQLFRINVTHPPTQYRIGFLETEPQTAGATPLFSYPPCPVRAISHR